MLLCWFAARLPCERRRASFHQPATVAHFVANFTAILIKLVLTLRQPKQRIRKRKRLRRRRWCWRWLWRRLRRRLRWRRRRRPNGRSRLRLEAARMGYVFLNFATRRASLTGIQISPPSPSSRSPSTRSTPRWPPDLPLRSMPSAESTR